MIWDAIVYFLNNACNVFMANISAPVSISIQPNRSTIRSTRGLNNIAPIITMKNPHPIDALKLFIPVL